MNMFFLPTSQRSLAINNPDLSQQTRRASFSILGLSACLLFAATATLADTRTAATEPPATSFTFKLPVDAMTSAGVYDSEGVLLRTLWRGESFAAGSHVGTWDNQDDLGSTVANGTYTVKLIRNNVSYTWEGTIGNTSSSFTGPGVWKSSVTAKGILDMATDGTNLFAVKGHDEGKVPMFRATVAEPMAVAENMIFGPNSKGSHWMGFRHVATDGNRIYISSSLTGYDKSSTAFVIVLNANDSSRATFDGYGEVVDISRLNGETGNSTRPSAFRYDSAIDVTTNGPKPAVRDNASGLAVQKSGTVLAVAHDTLNRINLYNKTTGQPLGSIPATNVQQIAFAPNGDLWGIHNGGSVSRWTSVGANNQLVTNLSGLSDPLAVAVHPTDVDLVYVADGGSSQQIKAFSRTGTLRWTFGVEGGYGTNSNIVSPTSADTARFDFKFGTFLTPYADGSLWVRDSGNYRNLHINPQPGAKAVYLRQLMWMSPYVVTCDPNKPQRLFSNWLEFEIDYAKPLQAGDPSAPGGNGSWKLVRNWQRALPENISLHATNGGFVDVVTLSNGRTYGLLRPTSGRNNLVMELMNDGSLRDAGAVPNKERLYANGDLRYAIVADNVETIYQRALSSFDSNGNPIWTEGTVIGSHPGNPETQPNGSASADGVHFPVTSSDVIAVFDGNGGSPESFTKSPKFRLGGVKKGATTWLWKASPAVLKDSPPDKKGSFPHVASASQVTGISVWAFGRSILYGYNGNSNGGDNQHKHFWDNGLFVGQFGANSRENPNDTSIAGHAHNILTVAQVNVDGVPYYYTSDEGSHAAVHRWRIDGIDTIVDMSVTVQVGTKGAGE